MANNGRNETGRRIRRVVITAELLHDMMTVGWVGGQVTCVAGLPPGAVFTASTFDPGYALVSLYFHHPSFDPVPDGETVPDLPVAWHWHGSNGLGVTLVNKEGDK